MDFHLPLHQSKSIKIICFLAAGVFNIISLHASLPDLEQWTENSGDETQLALIAEQLETWQSLRPDLNAISLKHLLEFPILSPDQSKKIVDIRKKDGPFKSWKDFAQRIGWTSRDVETMSVYFSLQKKSGSDKRYFHLSQQLSKTFPLSHGYSEHKYGGSPLKSEQRFDWQYTSGICGRLLIQKDAGENNWCDYQGGFIEIHPSKWIDKFILGNYYMQFGHGLVLPAPWRRSPAWQPVEFMQMPAQTLHGSGSASENAGFSGATVQYTLSGLQSTLFVSEKRRDATVYENSRIESLDMSGLHRTETEIQKKNTVSESVHGFRLKWQSGIVDIGLSAWQNHLSVPYAYRDIETHYYDFKGNQNHVIGLDWNIHWHSLFFSGECAQSRSGGNAILQSISGESQSVKWSLGFRTFSPDFHNPYTQSETQNLKAWYLAFEMNRNKGVSANFYLDYVRHPWRTYFTPLPSRDQNWMIQLNWHCLTKTDLKIQFKHKSDEAYGTVDNAWQISEGFLFPVLTETFRIEILGEVAQYIQYKIRLEQKKYYRSGTKPFSQKSKGWLCFYQLKYKRRKSWQCILRWTSFRTDDYNTRIYACEPDLPGMFSIPVYYLSGTSTLIVLHYQFGRTLALHVRYRFIYHDAVDSWGGGYDEIMDNQIHQAGFQVDWQF